MTKKLFYVPLLLLMLIGCNNASKNKSEDATSDNTKSMTNSEMIAYLNDHRADFDSLRNWMIADKDLQFMFLKETPDKRHLNSITQERADAYFDLMKKLNIPNIAHGNAYRNGIMFYFPEIKEGEKTISKGYVYRIDPSKGFKPNWVKVEGEVADEAGKLELNTFAYSPINEHWALIAIVQ